MSEGHRRAALALHALAPGDRDWMLARLPAPERPALERLLAELRELGIPAEPLPEGTLDAAKAVEASCTPRDRLRAAAALDVARAVEGESPRLVARVLAIEAWPWRDELMKRLSRARRRAVETESRALGAASTGEKLAGALTRSIADRLAARRDAPRPHALARLVRWRWRRAA